MKLQGLSRASPEVCLALITDYHLGDGVGTTLIDAMRQLGFRHGWHLLQSGALRSALLRDPVVQSLCAGEMVAKSVSFDDYIKRLPYFARVWNLPYAGVP